MSRGTWRGSGTFETGGPDPAAVLAVLIGVLLIGGGGAAALRSAVTSALVIAAIVVGVLVVAGAVILVFAYRATRRREAAYAASDRHRQIMARVAEVTAEPQVKQGARVPALEQHVHYHYHGTEAQPALRVVRGEVEP